MTDKVRAAVIGAGYLGRFHAEKYARHTDVELVGVCDTNQNRATELAEAMKVDAVFDHKELAGRVDAVSIVVPTAAHHCVARDFLEAGADVLVEKPFTTTLEEADDLIGLAEEKGRIICVGHLERFNRSVKGFAEELTDPVFIEARRLSVFKARAANVDVVVDLMIHDLDLVFHFVKSEVAQMTANGGRLFTEHLDWAECLISFENGCRARLFASRAMPADERSIMAVVPGGALFVDLINRKLSSVMATRGDAPTAAAWDRIFDKSDALGAEIESFVQSVRTRTPPPVTGQVARRALAAAHDVIRMASA